jgi:glycosyltransferase involved in cell wall biosynthesis
MPPTPSSAADTESPATNTSDRLWVVLPVHNEAGAIERVILEWIPVLGQADPAFSLLVIDDGSTDETPAILDRLARDDPRLRIVRQPNLGHGAACLLGYEIATSGDSDADFILQIDSDGQCDPADFTRFWNTRREHSQQLGRRRRRQDGWPRAATSRVLRWLVSLAAGRSILDPNVPYRLLTREALARAVERLRAGEDVQLVNAALSVICVEAGPVRWVDIGFRQRYAGRSKYRARRMARLATDLLRWLIATRPRGAHTGTS